MKRRNRIPAALLLGLLSSLLFGGCLGISDRGQKMTLQIPALLNLEVDYVDTEKEKKGEE